MAPSIFPIIEPHGAGLNHDGAIKKDGKRLSTADCRGRIPSIQASRLRTMIQECWREPTKILATAAADDSLTARLVEQAGFPVIFLGGFAVASSFGLPDTGYIAFQEMATRIQDVSRSVSIPIIADGDTGYGSPASVRRTVSGFATAGAAGIMVEDQTWPKRCGHTKGKSVVSREEAFARLRAATDARDEGLDIVIIARTDSLILGWEEALFRAQKFAQMGADVVFIEALPDRAAMERAARSVDCPLMGNIIEGGLTENISAKDLASMGGFVFVVYPFTMVAARVAAARQALQALKKSLDVGAPPMIMSAKDVCTAVGFEEYWALEERYAY